MTKDQAELSTSPKLSQASPAGDSMGVALAAKSETCPNCQSEFVCQPGHCWCDAIYVPADALVEIGQKYERCLCPDCLDRCADRYRRDCRETPGH